jgi:hypothetical protein
VHVGTVHGLSLTQSLFVAHGGVPLLLELDVDDDVLVLLEVDVELVLVLVLVDELELDVVEPPFPDAWKRSKFCVQAIGAIPREARAMARTVELRTLLPPRTRAWPPKTNDAGRG